MHNDKVRKLAELKETVSQKEEEVRRYKLKFNRQTRKLISKLLSEEDVGW